MDSAVKAPFSGHYLIIKKEAPFLSILGLDTKHGSDKVLLSFFKNPLWWGRKRHGEGRKGTGEGRPRDDSLPHSRGNLLAHFSHSKFFGLNRSSLLLLMSQHNLDSLEAAGAAASTVAVHVTDSRALWSTRLGRQSIAQVDGSLGI
jgi:hypothetical protein